MTPTVLVVEDEDALATLLQYNLEKEGYRVIQAGDGEEALILVQEELPDLVVLDWMLPKVSGIEVCRRLRQRPESRNLPILMLTARGEESDRVRGLDTGADDYVVKPFAMSELTARIRAVMRRIRPGLADDRVTCGDIVMDRVAHRVKRGGQEVHLLKLLLPHWLLLLQQNLRHGFFHHLKQQISHLVQHFLCYE